MSRQKQALNYNSIYQYNYTILQWRWYQKPKSLQVTSNPVYFWEKIYYTQNMKFLHVPKP